MSNASPSPEPESAPAPPEPAPPPPEHPPTPASEPTSASEPTPATARLRALLHRAVPATAREPLHALGVALATPTRPGAPLLAKASSRWLRRLPYAVAFAFVATLLPVTITVLMNEYRLNGALAGALGTAQTAPLLLAVTRPLQAWWIILPADFLGALALIAADGTAGRPWPWTPMVVVGYLALMLAVGLREPRRTLLGVWLLTGLAGWVCELLAPELSEPVHVLLFVLSGVLLLITGTLRERGDAQRRLVEQETISEAERARRTLLEERARIARELHDVVAHHMSVITVQADSAPYRIPDLPEAAREEFGSIAVAARESLAEMRRLLVVLRSEGTEGERAPQPGLDRVQQLIEATVRAGVPTELSLAAELEDVPQAVDLSAYRIVQEALANVMRHAPGARTRVSVQPEESGDWLTVLVVNGPSEERGSRRGPLESGGTGHGLIGMRERVRLTGGTLDTGPLPDGGFRVAARLPLRTDPLSPTASPTKGSL
ncbi:MULTISPECIES: sensor histidine kinase [Streptomyces]|uniref:histidine kinase n=1 Tax=Streptomyces solicathayae TaxID=3081768 RepID=A0ABZ0LYP5_9ACTN|nr:sensor histidine kinase [Streptomyces sp. HUAS YS2]WOX24567.1 sensor histidine kinase [Streptomyces sp. HUAS YS2]